MNTINTQALIKTRKEFLVQKLSKGHTVGITWEAKKGESRACISLKNWKRTGTNTTKHIDHYMTVWCRNRKRFVNLNLLTIKEVRADKQVYKVA